MPRPALAAVSTPSLLAEIQKRLSKLDSLLKLRADVDAQINQLQALAAQFGLPAAADAPAASGPVRRGRGRKVAVAAATKPAPAKRRKRRRFGMTATDFVLGLLKGKTLTTRQLSDAWKKVGRGGKVDNELTRLVKIGSVKRESLGGKLGSNYSLA